MNPANQASAPSSPSACGARSTSGPRRAIWLVVLLATAAVVGIVLLFFSPDGRPPRLALNDPALQANPDRDAVENGIVEQHPLAPALKLARRVADNIDAKVRDYTATVLKQERVGKKLSPLEVCFVKVRHEPFSVYMKFLAPEDLKGQEVIYFEGANDGKMFAHAGSGLRAWAGTVQIEPKSPIAMLGQRYPITELGIANLTRRLIEVGEHDQNYGECYVWIDDEAKVGDRPCTSITVMHPFKRKGFLFHIARIFVDNELLSPLHYEAYDWPEQPGEPPALLERYTYANLNLNPGLTDADFDPKNPEYHFGLP